MTNIHKVAKGIQQSYNVISNKITDLTANKFDTGEYKNPTIIVDEKGKISKIMSAPKLPSGPVLPSGTYKNPVINIDENGKINSISEIPLPKLPVGVFKNATINVNENGNINSITESTIKLDAGIGLIGGINEGTISLSDTSVTPGTYENPIITVDQQGRITSIAPAASYPVPNLKITNSSNSSLDFDIKGISDTTTTLTTNQTINRTINIPDNDVTLIGTLNSNGQLIIGSNNTLHNSTAGVQLASIISNGANFRANQYGSTGIPGFIGFKSRGDDISSTLSVISGDILFRDTAVGVAGDNNTISMAGYSQFIVPENGVTDTSIASNWELYLTDTTGTRSSKLVVTNNGNWSQTSSGQRIMIMEGINGMQGVNTLIAGTIIVNNNLITQNSRISLTPQNSAGTPGFLSISLIPSVGFIINSTSDTDVRDIFWQIWEPAV